MVLFSPTTNLVILTTHLIIKQDGTIYTVDCGAEIMISQYRNYRNISLPIRVQPSCQRQIVSLPMTKWNWCFPYPVPSPWTTKSCDWMMPDNWIMFVKMTGVIRKFVDTKLHIKNYPYVQMVWLVCERRLDLWPRPSLRSLRQTKSLTSSAAGENLCCRFSFTPELTKQAKLPLLLAVEFKSDGVEPPNRMEAERPRCLFPASMLAVFICCSWPYSLRISSWNSKHDGPIISYQKLKLSE